MATIEIADGNLVITLHGFDKFLALRSQLTIPLAHIRAVTVRPPDAHGDGAIHAYRVAGAYMPDSITAGYFWVTSGLGLTPKPVIEAIRRAKSNVETWPVEEGGHRDRAVLCLQKAEEEVVAGAQAAGLDLDDPGKGWAFYDVRDPNKTIGFELEHERLKHVVIELDDLSPEEASDKVLAAIRNQ